MTVEDQRLRQEMTAYETLWAMRNATQKTVTELFQKAPALPSGVLEQLMKQELFLRDLRESVEKFLERLNGFSISLNGIENYPTQLRSASYPLELFYFRGEIELAKTPSVAVVGARKASELGVARAKRLAKELVSAGFTVVSGLAAGIDTAAMTSAIDSGGRTIGVIGTPITETYPKENKLLQERVATDHLLISQVPFYRYKHQPFQTKKFYFPQRNETMAALSQATIVVEASDTSGSLTQARAGLQQGRKLFILNSCFENPDITWPTHYEGLGAMRVRSTNDIIDNLNAK